MFNDINTGEDGFFASNEIDTNFEELDSSELGEVISKDITEAISGTTIKEVIVDQEDSIKDFCCIIDFTNYTDLTEQSLKAIKNLLVGGEYKVYVKSGESVQGIGTTHEMYAVKLLPLIVNMLYSNRVPVLIRRNGKIHKYNKSDISVIRLKLR